MHVPFGGHKTETKDLGRIFAVHRISCHSSNQGGSQEHQRLCRLLRGLMLCMNKEQNL